MDKKRDFSQPQSKRLISRIPSFVDIFLFEIGIRAV